ncbi:MAG: LPXTG cell wall anchor domain-containing protein [Elusimicrobiota bacterium]|nr:MAG: LPXTG cell wall anchor domain-containing protein [Elusimicrobiota bacterium]
MHVESSASTLRNTGKAAKMTHLDLSRERAQAAARYALDYLKTKGYTLDEEEQVTLDFEGSNKNGTSGPSSPFPSPKDDDPKFNPKGCCAPPEEAVKIAAKYATATAEEKAELAAFYDEFKYVQLTFDAMFETKSTNPGVNTPGEAHVVSAYVSYKQKPQIKIPPIRIPPSASAGPSATRRSAWPSAPSAARSGTKSGAPKEPGLLILLAALLLSGPPVVRAEDPPPPQTAEDPRDVDHDGTVSGKERRRARRADRRARRGEKTATGEVAVDEEQDAADAEASAERGQSASRAAAGAAAAMKGMLPSADAGAMPGSIPGAEAGKAGGATKSEPGTKASASQFLSGGAAGTPGAGSPKPSGDPGKPSAASDFVLAARSGYAPAFSAAGLKLSADGRSIVRADGSPASADDYARLQREIGSMPGALGRRPDFFSAVSPERYADLKRGYKDRKEGDPVFKDVGTTENDRDFVHTASCDKLSSGCNDSVEKPYKKGDYVAPEDLDSMWSALQKELDGSAAQGDGNMSLSASRSALARDKAVEAAEALSDDPGTPEEKKKREEEKAAAASSGAAATPVAQAVTAAQKLFDGVRAIALPGRDPQTGEGGNPLPLIVGGAVAALGLGVLILRRKG